MIYLQAFRTCCMNIIDLMKFSCHTGNRCPAGHYCESGVGWPTPCSPGTYSPTEGNTQPSDCLSCQPGEFCGDYNLTTTSGKQFFKFSTDLLGKSLLLKGV